jgi:hypothetical protein
MAAGFVDIEFIPLIKEDINAARTPNLVPTWVSKVDLLEAWQLYYHAGSLNALELSAIQGDGSGQYAIPSIP